MYTCQNPECGESWETTPSGGLIPCIGGGYWVASREIKQCPCCDDEEKYWKFVVDRSIKEYKI
jgi:hypothetical protein